MLSGTPLAYLWIFNESIESLQHHYLRFLIIASLFIFSASNAEATTYQSVFHSKYSDEKGRSRSVADLKQDNQHVLVLLWAHWCEPCKKELKWGQKGLADRPERLAVVSINVDDSSDQPAAKSFLKGLTPSYKALFDPDGKHFYTYHQSGQLPLVLLFSPSGDLLNKWSALHEKQRDSIYQTVELSQSPENTTQDKISLTNSLRYREQNSSPIQKVIAERFNATASSKNYSISVNYDQLHQTNRNGKFNSYEDEIGYSFARTDFSLNSSSELGVRLGGHNTLMNGGYLFAARTNRELNENLFLFGGSVSYKNDLMQAEVISGEIRNNLYPSIIDPGKDLSVSLPDSKFTGASLNLTQIDFGLVRWKPGIFMGNIERNQNIELGFSKDYEDRRQGIFSDFTMNGLSVSAIGNRYQSKDVDDGFSQSLQVSTEAFDLGSFSINISAGAQKLFIPDTDAYPYVSVPYLTDELATPITKNNREERRAMIRISNPTLQGFFIEPLYAEQTLLDNEATDRLYNQGLKVGFTDLQLKLQLSQTRRNDRHLDQRDSEKIGAISYPIYGDLTGFTEYRWRNIDRIEEGRSIEKGIRGTTGFVFHKEFGDGHIVKFDNYYYWLSGPYLSQSGLNDDDFWSHYLSYSYKWASLSIISGKEPGGYVCTAGNCQYREPRDGIELESGININF